MATSPSLSRFTFPAPSPSPSPTRRHREPPPSPKHHYIPTYSQQSSGNAHPYAVRTTSTGVLTRSNSITQDHTKHNYVPASPHSRENSFIKHEKQDSFGTSRAHGSGHRYSRSLSNDLEPRPLPSLPPPSGPSLPPSSVEQDDLPANPKHWSSSQLSAYLSTALRVRGGAELPNPVAQDISNFVVQAHINGRAFLRLSESDLEGFHINQLWRASLLSASHNLRQNVLQGRIWGFGNEGQTSPTSPNKSPFVKKPSYSNAITTDPESLYDSGNSSSSVDISTPSDSKDTTPVRMMLAGRFKNGRVKGMVQNWEVRSGSESGSASESSEVEEEEIGGTVKRLLPAPPIVHHDFASNGVQEEEDVFGTITAHSPSSNYGDRPLPAPPLHPSLQPMSIMTPPLRVSMQPVGGEEELSMDELLRMNGIAPERTRIGKRKAARAKALAQEDPEEDADAAGVQAWLAPDGVTVKRIGEDSGRKVKAKTIAPVTLGSLFEAPKPEPRDDKIDRLRQQLSETQDLAYQLAARVEEYEGRIVQMGILSDELNLEDKRQSEKESSVDSGVALSSAYERDHVEEAALLEELKALKEENEILKAKIEYLEAIPPSSPSLHSSSVSSPPLVQRLLSFFSSSGSTSQARLSKAIEDHLRVRSLPGYIVLVSIGVCVVCLKVLGRRVLGRGVR
ncbi:hypothetical protein DL96DRAFT_1676263 [Flagelloscypha sp. PMI_526]|nr:hypothetical protein DL96DRAFT_1676263 [Flagelloscypha sp. PMI_526]